MIGRTSNISMIYLRNLTGYPSTDLGTLCTAPTINRWAKYKPVRSPFTNVRPSDWWKSVNNNCGININIYNNLSSMVSAMQSGSDLFAYERPRGGASEPYRAGDFAKYNTLAPAPAYSERVVPVQYKINGLQVMCRILGFSSDNINLEDIYGSNFSTLYYSIGVKHSSWSDYQYITDTNNIFGSSSGITLTWPSAALTTGTYQVIQFLSEEKRPSVSDPVPINRFTPLYPFGNGGYIQSVTIYDTPVTITLYTQMETANLNRIKVWFRVKNNSSDSVYLNNINVRLRYADNAEFDAMEVGEGVADFANMTIAASSTVDSPIQYKSGLLPDIDLRGGFAWLNANNGGYTAQSQINQV